MHHLNANSIFTFILTFFIYTFIKLKESKNDQIKLKVVKFGLDTLRILKDVDDLYLDVLTVFLSAL